MQEWLRPRPSPLSGAPKGSALHYKSCRFIESGLVFADRALQYCCRPHSDGTKGYVKICDYDGGPLPTETILGERARLIEQNNTAGVESPCTGCECLVEAEWPEEGRGLTFDWIGIDSYFICNLKCAYCHVVLHEDWDLPEQGYDLLSLFRELIEAGRLAPGVRVVWGGGEPTILKTFAEIQELLAQHDVDQQINTNAVKYSERLEESLRRGVAELVTSVDAGTRETYRRVKGADAMEEVWANLERYATVSDRVTAKYILRYDNVSQNDVVGFIRHCAAIGVRQAAVTTDEEEVHQGGIGEDHAWAVALMEREARRCGVELEIVEEYLPDDRAAFLKYVPLEGFSWPRTRIQLGRAVTSAIMKARQELRRAKVHRRVRAGLERAHQLAHGGPRGDGRREQILELLGTQVEVGNDTLGRTLVEVARSEPEIGRIELEAVGSAASTGFGLTEDGWTVEGTPSFVALDGGEEGGTRPVLWLACYAAEEHLPIEVELIAAERPPQRYTFHRPERRRIELPDLEPGELRIYSIHTDRAWTPDHPGETRRLGVHVSTSAKLG